MTRLLRIGMWGLCGTFAVATFAMLAHSPGFERQGDAQLTRYAFEFLQSLQEGDVLAYVLEVRKYPFLPALLLSVPYAMTVGSLVLAGRIASLADIPTFLAFAPATINLLGRGIALAAAAATIAGMAVLSRKLFPTAPRYASVVPLLSSVLFLLFATAVRPHIFVAAATVFAALAALPLLKDASLLRVLSGFGAAALAFSMLQSGFFAIIFPIGAYLMRGGGVRWRRLLEGRLFLGIAFFLFLASLLGYPFVWNLPLGREAAFGFDLGHNYIRDHLWNGRGFGVLLAMLFGGEGILGAFALLGGASLVRRRGETHPFVFVVLAYVAALVLVFGFYSGTGMRFFLPVLPFLALLGAPVLARARAPVLLAILFAVAVLHVRIALLAIRPDTYDVVRQFVLEQTQGPLMTDVPWYALGIPPTRRSIAEPQMARERYLLQAERDNPDARDIVPMEQWREAAILVTRQEALPDPAPGWRLCLRTPSRALRGEGYLWAEEQESVVPWLLMAERLGPSLSVYCRS